MRKCVEVDIITRTMRKCVKVDTITRTVRKCVKVDTITRTRSCLLYTSDAADES